MTLIRLLVLLLIAWPAVAAEDFTARDSCMWFANRFDDGLLASSKIDHCDGVSQDNEANNITWLDDVEVADGVAPPGSPVGADSTYHDDGVLQAGNADSNILWSSTGNITAGGWWNNEGGGNFMLRWGWTPSANGSWLTERVVGSLFRARVHGTYAGSGPSVPIGTWMFAVLSYDGGSATGIVKSFATTSEVPLSLWDCGGGSQTCGVEDGALENESTIEIGVNNIGGKKWRGWEYGLFIMNETLSPEEICQWCRCGGQNDVRGVGRVDACNRCIVPDYEGCRRVID